MTTVDLERTVSDLSGKVDAILALLRQQQQPKPCAYTLYTWLDEWATTYKAATLRPKSYAQILALIRLHIKPHIPDKPLNLLTALDVQKALGFIVSTRMRKYAYDTLGAALRQAYRLKLAPENVMTQTDPVIHRRTIGKALTLDQQGEFLQALEGNKLKPLYLFYLLTGCRRSEALAVTWGDIDRAARRIWINGSKTDRARRFVPLFPETEKLLDVLPRSGSRLFPCSVNLLNCNFKRLKAAYGFDFRLHDLRHTFATRCLESGIPASVFGKWLGHAQTSTTLNLYAHVQTDFELSEASRFNPKLSDPSANRGENPIS